MGGRGGCPELISQSWKNTSPFHFGSEPGWAGTEMLWGQEEGDWGNELFLLRVEDEVGRLTLGFCVSAPAQLLREIPKTQEQLGPSTLYPGVKGKVPRTLAALPLSPINFTPVIPPS